MIRNYLRISEALQQLEEFLGDLDDDIILMRGEILCLILGFIFLYVAVFLILDLIPPEKRRNSNSQNLEQSME